MELAELLRQLDLEGFPAEAVINVPEVGTAWAVELPGERSFDRWENARRAGARIDWNPVAVGSVEELEFLREMLERENDTRTPADELRDLATQLDVDAWLRERADEGDLTPPRHPWPDDIQPTSGFYFPFDDDGKHLARWWMLLVPAAYDWEVPVQLGWGGFNECPPAEVHGAFLRRWSHRYDAELVAITSDTFELMVHRPPRDRDEAIELATEQYLYCPDIVEQGYGSIDAHAASLIGGATWFLWWD